MEDLPEAAHVADAVPPVKEKRAGERLVQSTMKWMSVLFFGPGRKYKAIHGKTVAAAMFNAAKRNGTGFFTHTYDEINELSR